MAWVRQDQQQTKHWRKDNLGDWSEDVKQRLLKDIKDISNIFETSEIKNRIILIGPIGSGKSSLINSFNSALRGRIDKRAISGGNSLTTKRFVEYPTYYPKTKQNREDKQRPFTLCDTRGLGSEDAAASSYDILEAILGQKPVSETFVPGTKDQGPLKELFNKLTAQLVLYVVDAAVYRSKKRAGKEKRYISQLQELKRKTDDWPIARALILTHIDEIDPDIEKENGLKEIHKSKLVKELVDEIKADVGIPEQSVFPIENCVSCVDDIPLLYSCHLLYTFYNLAMDAVDICHQRQFEVNRRKDEVTSKE